MRKHLFLLLAAALCVASCGRYHYETVEGDPLQTSIYTLDNGLRVYMSVNKAEPRIQTYIAVRVGGKNDPSETTGLAHYFEHLMFKGTQQFGTSDYAAEKPLLDRIEQLFEQYRVTSDETERAAVYREIDSISYEASKLSIPNEYDKLMSVIGADGTNAWTSTDETVYTEDIPSNQIDNWARIQADRFKNIVIRGFHTELETIYEEKNMSLTQDRRKVWEALDKSLFPHHPYGKQTVLGTQEHLKNPSITNVKKYHDDYYVPNNVAICVSGDFEPDEMVAAIEKYFGDWKPNPSVPQLRFEPETDITTPVVSEVYGLEAENVCMGWRLPGAADLKASAVASVAAGILSNGQAGLMDIDVMQSQKALSMYGGYESRPDYGEFIVMARPKKGQSLEQLRDIALVEIAKLRSGDFDESLVTATASNLKLSYMQSLEDNGSRAIGYVESFINGVSWSDYVGNISRIEAVTKDDVIDFANRYLGADSYAVVYKRVGEDRTVQKISAPKITPIEANRDLRSDFLAEVQASEVKPVEPVFVDFSRDMSVSGLCEGVQVLYTRNTIGDIFRLQYVFNTGREDNPSLPQAVSYINYLGTPAMSATQRASELYGLACDFSVSCGATSTTVSISGLSENMGRAVAIVDDLLQNAVADEDVLASLKEDELRSRSDAKTQQRACFGALRTYVTHGADYVRRTTLSNASLRSLKSADLLAAVSGLYSLGHEILYYGPESLEDVEACLRTNHTLRGDLRIVEEKVAPSCGTPSNQVYLAQYDAKQIYYTQYSNRGEKFCAGDTPGISLYNEYFGGGMNTIVFQEMREARGLAYSAWANLSAPADLGDTYSYTAFIATQNDKMQTAIEAFDDIINNMPESEAALSVAKDAIESRLRTERVIGMDLLRSYRRCRRLGLDEPQSRDLFEALPSLTMDSVRATQLKWVKDRPYTYAILGDVKDLDVDYLRNLGPVRVLSQKEIFGW